MPILNRSESDVSTESKTSLDPEDWNAFREQAHRMLNHILDHQQSIAQKSVWQEMGPDIREGFRESLPQGPRSLQEIHRRFQDEILPYTLHNTHPRFFGWVQGGGTPVGLLAEMLAGGLNANVGGRDQSPVVVERQIQLWVKELFGFPETSSGVLVTGSSMANWIGLLIARNGILGEGCRHYGMGAMQRPCTLYASESVHRCIAQAADMLGMGTVALRKIPIDSDYRIDVGVLERTIHADREAGNIPLCVVGTAGAVDTGAIDDLKSLARICKRERMWFHVDGAFGALAMFSSEHRGKLEGISEADSIAFDFHKWAQVPYDAGYLIVRDGELHRRSFQTDDPYLKREEQGPAGGSPWPCDFGPDLSRGFRALKVWMTIQAYGVQRIGQVIDHTCLLAQYLADRLEGSREFEVLAPVPLNIVCFRYRFDASEKDRDWLNRQLLLSMQTEGGFVPSSTHLQNRFAIRAAILNHRTTLVDIDALYERLLHLGRALERGQSAKKAG